MFLEFEGTPKFRNLGTRILPFELSGGSLGTRWGPVVQPIDNPRALSAKAVGAKRVLFTVDELARLGGAEMVVIELVEWFAGNGWFVDVLTRRLRSPLAEELRALLSTRQLVVHQDPEEWLNPDWFDLVWVTHSLLPLSFLSALIEGRRLPNMFWAHLGSLVPLEAVNFLELETATATRILAVSPRTEERLVESGLPAGRISIFDNPAPVGFTGSSVPRRARLLEQLLVVSNHPPDEVLFIRHLLAARGISFRHIGARGDHHGRVTPELLPQRTQS